MEKTLQRQKDKKEKEKTRRELLGKLFFDFAKLVFAALVLGGIVVLFQGKNGETISNFGTYYMLTLGIVCILIFVSVGNKILK